MSELTTLARQAVRAAYPDLATSYGEPPDPIITIPPAHPEFGPLEIMDDEIELTVNCGRFTHVHLSNYEEGITSEVRARRIVADLVEFLGDVFADRMEFWGTHAGGGGCHLRDASPGISRFWVRSREVFTWSGPIGK